MKQIKIVMWIARDEDRELFLYSKKPIKFDRCFAPKNGRGILMIDEQLFPEVTFENSPVEVELKINK